MSTQLQKKTELIQTDECPSCGEEIGSGIGLLLRMSVEVDGNYVSHCRDCACEMFHNQIMRNEYGKIVKTSENLKRFFFSIERSHYLEYLLIYFQFIVENCPDLFGDLYTEKEFIYDNLDRWKMWFQYIKDNNISIMNPEDKKIYDELPDEIKIYRGSIDEDGTSWTLSKEKAEWFRDRWDDDEAELFERTVKKSDIVAYFGERDEQEVIYLESCD